MEFGSEISPGASRTGGRVISGTSKWEECGSGGGGGGLKSEVAGVSRFPRLKTAALLLRRSVEGEVDGLDVFVGALPCWCALGGGLPMASSWRLLFALSLSVSRWPLVSDCCGLLIVDAPGPLSWDAGLVAAVAPLCVGGLAGLVVAVAVRTVMG